MGAFAGGCLHWAPGYRRQVASPWLAGRDSSLSCFEEKSGWDATSPRICLSAVVHGIEKDGTYGNKGPLLQVCSRNPARLALSDILRRSNAPPTAILPDRSLAQEPPGLGEIIFQQKWETINIWLGFSAVKSLLRTISCKLSILTRVAEMP